MYKNQSDAATHAQYQHQAKYDRGFPYVERAVFRVSREAASFQFYWLFFFFLCTAYIVKGTFFRSIWNLFALVGFSKTSTAFDLRASFWLDKKKSANKFQIEFEFVLLPRNNL